jgi:polysaccharide biosynthesis protein PslH
VLLVGGHDPDGPVAALAGIPSVTVAGFVDDLRPCYEEAEVVVAPISSGGGTRIKLLEAFAHGVPVVTTPTGAAGLATRDHEHLLVATGAEELAAAVAEVLDDPVLAGSLAAAALDYVRENHRPDVVAGHVRSLLGSDAVR